MDDDVVTLPGWPEADPHLRRRRWRTPLLGGAALLTVIATGVPLVGEARREPERWADHAATAQDAHHLTRPADGLPPRPVPVPVSGRRVSLSLLDVRPGGEAFVRLAVDGRVVDRRLHRGGAWQEAGLLVVLLDAHAGTRAQDDHADVLVTPVLAVDADA